MKSGQWEHFPSIIMIKQDCLSPCLSAPKQKYHYEHRVSEISKVNITILTSHRSCYKINAKN